MKLEEENFKLSKEKKQELLGLIREFFLKERDEEIGELAAMAVLDFVMENLAKEFYNQGVLDAHHYLEDKILDLLELQK